MAKTTILIQLTIGAQQPAYPAYVAFRSPHRFVSGQTVVLPEPAPVVLAPDGTGVVSVDPGVWLVDEIMPTQTFRRAVIVPESGGTVAYSSLVEVTDMAEIGYAPTWASAVLAAALAAAVSAAEAAASVAGAGDVVRGVINFDETPPGPGVWLRRPEGAEGPPGDGVVPVPLLGTPISATARPVTGDLSITPHPDTAPGDRVIVAVTAADSSNSVYTMSGGSGTWETLTSGPAFGTAKLFVFSKVFVAGDAGYTLSRTGSDGYRIVPITLQGSDPSVPPIVGALGTRAASGGTTATTAPSIATSVANSIVLMISGERTAADDGAVTVNNGFTVLHDAHTVAGDNLQSLFVATKEIATPGIVGATTATYTAPHAVNSGALLIGIAPEPA